MSISTDAVKPAARARKSPSELVEHLPFELDEGIARRAAIGLIVLATDSVIETEFARVMAPLPGIGLYGARIHYAQTTSPESLAAMESSISATADLILPGVPLDVVAYGCTSGAMVIGEARVTELIHTVRPGVKVTTPITAAFAAFDAFKAKRIAVLTPYRRDVNEIVRAYMEGKGYEVPVLGSFCEERDARVTRISAESVRRGVAAITAKHKVDMVFVSCTGVRLLDVAASIEQETGLPVTSSNHALAWHCLRLAGIEDKAPELGRLYAK